MLHLNGYKINNPTLLARISHEELEALFVGYGYTPLFVEGSARTVSRTASRSASGTVSLIGLARQAPAGGSRGAPRF